MTTTEIVLDFRQRAALALLPPEKKAWLDALPPDMFEKGLMVLDQENRGIDGRTAWTEGVRCMTEFVANPDVFVHWIRTGDLFSLDCLMAIILDMRAARCRSTQTIDPSLWGLLERGEQMFSRLLLDRVDYPGLVHKLATRKD